LLIVALSCASFLCFYIVDLLASFYPRSFHHRQYQEKKFNNKQGRWKFKCNEKKLNLEKKFQLHP
jgi:hypothetical protein